MKDSIPYEHTVKPCAVHTQRPVPLNLVLYCTCSSSNKTNEMH